MKELTMGRMVLVETELRTVDSIGFCLRKRDIVEKEWG